jgi:hypothetical protein
MGNKACLNCDAYIGVKATYCPHCGIQCKPSRGILRYILLSMVFVLNFGGSRCCYDRIIS